MKKFVVLLVISLHGLLGNSQSLLGDYLKDAGYEGHHSDVLVEAVKPALSIIRQQYRLERNGQFFGKNNMPFYGETYSLGVKISGGVVLQNQVLFPWKVDADYLRVNQSGKYKPVYFWSYQRALNDSIYKAVELELGTEYVCPINNDSLIFVHTDAQSDFGLSIDDTPGEKTGLMIWAYASNMKDSAMHVTFKQSSMKIVAAKDSVIVLDTKEKEKILGGLYVVPKIERAGLIKVNLVGVAALSDKKEWTLSLLTKDNNPNDTKKKKVLSKKNQEQDGNLEPTPIKI